MDETNEAITETTATPELDLNDKITDLSSQIEALKKHNETLIGEKRAKDEEARKAIDTAERDRLEKSNDVELYKKRVADLEAKIEESAKAITERDFEQSLREAVAKHKVRPDGLADLFDLLKVRSQHRDGQTTVGVTPINEYLADYFNTDSGRHWLQPSGSSGSGAPGATSTNRSPTMTKENFNMTEYMTLPKVEREAIANTMGDERLKKLNLTF